MSRIAYVGLTLALLVASLALAGVTGWIDYLAAAAARGQVASAPGFTLHLAHELALHWQAAFLQVLWQVVGLALVLQLGTATARERAERVERKLDALLHYLALDREREEIDSNGERRD